ncbi:hypothetical protein ANCCAN_23894 [Ancylostoma caninum]|uniref:SET domain-containing protein n=1 Tax=Ancylostoma caninum TaxID=29170 RepID=A0A368FE40_ANCCA|nr:hypothetical protein ANCCAN_23894 [Ancylostoma caninum]
MLLSAITDLRNSDTYRYAVLAHEQVHKKTVTLGRLFNHGGMHPNLRLEISNHSCSTTKEVHAGEQLLWNYGNKYRGAQLRRNYICNACDPVLNGASTLDLCESTRSAAEPQEPEPWKEERSMSQHVSGWQRAPLPTRHLLLSVAMKANVEGLIAPHEGYSSAEDAYQRGREFISGREVRAFMSSYRKTKFLKSPTLYPYACFGDVFWIC